MMSDNDNGASDIQAESVGKTACHQCGHVMDLSRAVPFTVVACPQCGAKFSAPAKFGPFVLLKLLGRGEMGATYKALDKHLGRNVAIKVMRRALGEDQARVGSFLAEAKAIASLEHLNAVRVYSVGQEGGQPYIVMELIPGQPMSRLFAEGKPMDEAKALEIGIGVARALAAAAEIGLVHGDVKPANIMIDEKGTPKLVDFGIARFQARSAGQDDAIGTPYYVSPEQVRREPLDARSDMYALGATLFHALAGRPPFRGESVREVMDARLQRPAPDLRAERALLNPKTAAVVARMLEGDPNRRHADYDELLEDLRLAYFQVTGLETPELQGVVARPAIPVAAPAKVSPLRVALGVGGGAAVLAAVLAVWAIWLRGETEPTAVPATAPGRRQVAQPVFTPPAGTIAKPTAVMVTCLTALAEVRYTTDGSEPTEASRRYEMPILVRPGTLLRARAYREGWAPSAVTDALYARDDDAAGGAALLRGQATAAWERVQDLDLPAGAGAKVDECRALYATAEELWDQKAYKAARAPYEKLLKLCGELGGQHDARAEAIAARERASSVRERLDRALTRRESNAPWNREARTAANAFDRRDFAAATRQWRKAAELANAELKKQLSAARREWLDALMGVDAARLRARAGPTWQRIQRSLSLAGRAERDGRLDEAIVEHRRALQMLSEARRIARTDTVEDQKSRLVKRAGELLREGRLHKALAEVNKALALKPSSRSAAELKKQIVSRMVFLVDFGRGRRMTFVLIPPGRFRMGSPEDEPGRSRHETPHEVVIRKAFYMSECEVKQREFSVFVADRKYKTQAERERWSRRLVDGKWVRRGETRWNKPGFFQDDADKHPVLHVTWADAVEFCAWLSRKIDRKVRLPTEAEWEYACRAGTATRFSFGAGEARLHEHANYADKSAPGGIAADRARDDRYERTSPAGVKKPNAWGLRDMHGNVAEWCADRYGAYPPGRVTDPTGPRRGAERVARGGSWYHLPNACRSASRLHFPADHRGPEVGFRIVVEAK